MESYRNGAGSFIHDNVCITLLETPCTPLHSSGVLLYWA